MYDAMHNTFVAVQRPYRRTALLPLVSPSSLLRYMTVFHSISSLKWLWQTCQGAVNVERTSIAFLDLMPSDGVAHCVVHTANMSRKRQGGIPGQLQESSCQSSTAKFSRPCARNMTSSQLETVRAPEQVAAGCQPRKQQHPHHTTQACKQSCTTVSPTYASEYQQ